MFPKDDSLIEVRFLEGENSVPTCASSTTLRGRTTTRSIFSFF